MLTEDQVITLYPRAPKDHINAFVQQSDGLFQKYGIGENDNRLQFFLAQIGHESGGLTITQENLNYSATRLTQVWPKRFPDLQAAAPFANNPQKLANYVYAGRMGNGPSSSGDGWNFRGRGYIQITGRDGYANVGRLAGLDLVASPDEAFDPQYALHVACAFWEWKDLNPVCDTGNFERVTKIINGGVNGLEDRYAWLNKVRRVLGQPPHIDDHPSPEDVVAVQRALRAKGYTDVGAADGIIGPRTTAAINAFRAKSGLGAGGIDDALKEALGVTV